MAEALFVVVAAGGLFAAIRPKTFARYFLAELQRERLEGNIGALSWVGWVIFGCSSFMVVAMLVSDALRG